MKTKTLIALLFTATVLLAACKNNTSHYDEASNDTTGLAKDTLKQKKLIKTASMEFKVKDVENASGAINSLTVKYNGMVIHHDVTSAIEQTKDFQLTNDSVMRVVSIKTGADITVRVPSVKLEEFMNEVGRLSLYVTERKMHIEDQSLDYLSDQRKLQNRNQIIAQQKQGKTVIKNPSAVLHLKDDIIDEQINNQKINDAVKYSVLELHCYQSNRINKEIIVDDNPESYHIAYISRFGLAIKNGVTLFGEVVLMIVNMWLLIIIGLLAWAGYRYYKRKKNKPVLNNI